jgi:hypothetical protein
LNLLKVHLQPIMDQINRKYRKFRTPVIPQSQIQYLYDEQDPHHVVPDVTRSQFRPFELDKDKDGTPGLRETTSGKFYYNLETTTIEERLSNGFYARPKDFLADIRSLAKDARNIGDKDRTLKANELLTNAEVDVDMIEKNPIMADCENVYQRQLQRAKEREEKYRKRAEADAAMLSMGRTSKPPMSITSSEQTPGPLTLGEFVPGRRPPPLSAPFQTPSAVLNGSSGSEQHRLSNGSTIPSNTSHVDVTMTGTDDSQSQQNTPGDQAPQPPKPVWPGVSQAGGHHHVSTQATGQNTQQSQRSAFQPISQDVSPSALVNDASTTTSGEKKSNSNPSNRSSGWSTQATNGTGEPQRRGTSPSDSELPDTQPYHYGSQESKSDEQWPHSQAHALARGQALNVGQSPSTNSQHSSQNPPIPKFDDPPRPATLPSLPNTTQSQSQAQLSTSQASSEKLHVIDEELMASILPRLVEGTSGCSIEQLEQVYRELMDCIWRARGEWNRDLVGSQVVGVFNEVIVDMEEMQRLALGSQQ